jgi:hypothetical protein
MAYVRLKALDEEAQSIGSVVIGWQESGDAPFQGPPFSISFLKCARACVS